jgi:hypothetical protein
MPTAAGRRLSAGQKLGCAAGVTAIRLLTSCAAAVEIAIAVVTARHWRWQLRDEDTVAQERRSAPGWCR